MRLCAQALCVFVLGVAGAIAQVRLEGVRVGYAFDESAKALRPLQGTPGSAYLGSPVVLPFELQAVVLRGGIAVGIAGETAYWIRLSVDPASAVELGTATSAWLNASGDTALIANANQIRLITTTDGVPQVHPAVAFGGARLAAFLQEQNCVVVAKVDGGSTFLFRLCSDKPDELIPTRTLDGVTANAIAHNQTGLYIADSAAGKVYLLREDGAFETAAEGLSEPLALAALNSQEMLVAMKSSSQALVLTRSARSTIELLSPADRLEFIVPGRLIACSGTIDQPLMVLDLLQDRGSFFIPVLRGQQ